MKILLNVLKFLGIGVLVVVGLIALVAAIVYGAYELSAVVEW